MSRIRPARKKPRIGVVTLGCSKNIVDSEHLLAHLKVNDAIVVDVADADIAVINTCGFI
ncbi:MAG: 30S ribosomal protein S12 methylthiotransferase RimO, partial [Ignavibacteriales bacterium]|nr:30S ribosomal protein S12 methylthiotransferase RimO [Ignavibacteriales bacterium]